MVAEKPDGLGAPSSTETSTSWREPLGLVRSRLVHRLIGPETFSLGMVVAPAGSGKSRLLLHVASSYPGPVAPCGTPQPAPRSEGALVSYLWAALSAHLAPASSSPETIADLVRCSPGCDGPPILVILDDVHLMEGTEAEPALGSLVSRAPGWMRLLLAGRTELAIDLSRLRVSGRLVEIHQDDLRFRTWEVEELFRDIYRDPLVPEEVGALARRTGGWAAYLQLFHLATARKPPAVRRQVLAALSRQPRSVTDYLSRHVLADLSADLQDFLLRTSVLRRPSARTCDELLGRDGGSAARLAELERRQLFTERMDDGTYRYHPVLLTHLDALLIESIGLEAARKEHRRAGGILEREGLGEDALAAYAKSEDWAGVARVLGQADSPADLEDSWLEALPPSVAVSDSLVLMAQARRAVASGALAQAVRILRQAESEAVSSVVAGRCREQRERLAEWASPDPVKPSETSSWTALLRAATQREPGSIKQRAAGMAGAEHRFVEGLAAFLAGDHRSATKALRSVAANPEPPPWMAAAARMAACVVSSLAGDLPDPAEVERARDEIDLVGVPWLTRIARVALFNAAAAPVNGIGSAPDDLALELVEACEREEDAWGAALILLLQGMAEVRSGIRDPAALERAARSFMRLGAAALAAVPTTFVAAYSRTDAARTEVVGPASADLRVAGRETAAPIGPLPSAIGHRSGVAGISLICLGGFRLSLDGNVFDESAAKPMERSLLHLLAARAGEKVHREELVEALWPEADPDAGRHRLQVAVSSLRRLLADFADGWQLLVREGDAYLLALPSDADVDLWKVQRAMRVAADARLAGDLGTESASLQASLMFYGGQLLPMEGPAEWALELRSRLQTTVADGAVRLANLLLDAGDLGAAAEAARRGLSVDRYRDELWRVLIDAAERSGNHADATRTRKAYQEVLAELGVATR